MLRSVCLSGCCLSMLLTMAIGCGGHSGKPHESDRCPTMGTVTLDGKPLVGGSVTFVAVNDPSRRVTTPIRPNGGFAVADAPLGPVRIAVETESLRTANPRSYMRIPLKYGVFDTSRLTATIAKDGSQPLLLELKSK